MICATSKQKLKEPAPDLPYSDFSLSDHEHVSRSNLCQSGSLKDNIEENSSANLYRTCTVSHLCQINEILGLLVTTAKPSLS